MSTRRDQRNQFWRQSRQRASQDIGKNQLIGCRRLDDPIGCPAGLIGFESIGDTVFARILIRHCNALRIDLRSDGPFGAGFDGGNGEDTRAGTDVQYGFRGTGSQHMLETEQAA